MIKDILEIIAPDLEKKQFKQEKKEVSREYVDKSKQELLFLYKKPKDLTGDFNHLKKESALINNPLVINKKIDEVPNSSKIRKGRYIFESQNNQNRIEEIERMENKCKFLRM